MIEKNVCSMGCNEGSDLRSKIEVIQAASAVMFYIFHITAFLIKKYGVKVNVVTPQELGVCGE